MKELDLQLLWKEYQKDIPDAFKPVSVNDLVYKRRATLIDKAIKKYTYNFLVFFIAFLIVLSLMAYAYVYLKLELHFSTLLPMVLGALVLLGKSVSEYNRVRFFKNHTEKESVMQSVKQIRLRIGRIVGFDTIWIFVLCYVLSAVGTWAVVSKQTDLDYLLHEQGMKLLVWTFITLMLIVPWITKNILDREYKKAKRELDEMMKIVES